MHSSRMRTARVSGHLSCTPPTHTHMLPAMYALCHAHTTPPRMPPAMHASPPCTTPVNRITDWCKNNTFPQLRLRAVKIPCPSFGIPSFLHVSFCISPVRGAAPQLALNTLVRSYFSTRGLLAMNKARGGTSGRYLT